ncbi:hypothetical protein CLOP_g16013 [Closterium sp. NIES-67]|nr:hypothetical protein CLOP_g16013 [Closterium sp. NIES-67]
MGGSVGKGDIDVGRETPEAGGAVGAGGAAGAGAGADKVSQRCNGLLLPLAASHPHSLHHHRHNSHRHLLTSAVHMDLQRWILLDGSNLLFLRVTLQALRLLPLATSGYPPLLHLLLSAADPPTIASLQSALLLGELSVFKIRPSSVRRKTEISGLGTSKEPMEGNQQQNQQDERGWWRQQQQQQLWVSLVGDSWSWDGPEQQWLWQLAAAEAAGWGFPSKGHVGDEKEGHSKKEEKQQEQEQEQEEDVQNLPLLLLQASAAAAAASASSNPSAGDITALGGGNVDDSSTPSNKPAASAARHSTWEGPSCEALAGLEMLLLQASPSPALLSTLLSLPADRFGRLPCTVLRAWALKDPAGLCSLLREQGRVWLAQNQQNSVLEGGGTASAGNRTWGSAKSRSGIALRCNLLSLLTALDRIVQTDCRGERRKGVYMELSKCIKELL